jgi:hypothetical protein
MILLIRNFVTNFGQTLVSLARMSIMSGRVKKIEVDKNIRDTGVVILANGPSLNNMISESSAFLKGKKLMCVNSFPSSQYFTELKPDYCIISAPDYWLPNVRPEYIKMRTDLYNSLIKVDWEMVFFLPAMAKKCSLWNELLEKNKKVKIHFYNLTPIYGFRWFRNICYKSNIGMPRPHNILIPSIMMSIRMRFSNIYLWGADHSWLPLIYVDQENKVYLTHQHFYDKETAKPITMQKNVNEDRKLHEMLYKFVYTFEGYFFIREFAEKSKANIWNCTPGSFIDAFKRLKV